MIWMKRKLLLILALVLIILPTTTQAKEEISNDVTIFVNGKFLDENLSEIKNDRTFLPIRAISESLGLKVDYDHDANRKITIKAKDLTVEMNVNKDLAKVNGKEVKLDTKPYIKEDRTMVPIRFISENLNKDVNWNLRNRIVTVFDKRNFPEDSVESLYIEKLNGLFHLPKGYDQEIEVSDKYITEGKITALDKRYNEYKEELETFIPLFVIEQSRTYLTKEDKDEFNLGFEKHYLIDYNPETELFTYMVFSSPDSIPENFRGHYKNLVAKYKEAFKNYSSYSVDKSMDVWTYTGENKKFWDNLEALVGGFAPWYMVDNFIPYKYGGEFKDAKYSSVMTTSKSDGSMEVWLEAAFDKDYNLIGYKLDRGKYVKFDLSRNWSKEGDIKEIQTFADVFLNYPKDGKVTIKEDSSVVPKFFFNADTLKGYKDNFGAIYVIDPENSYIVYFQKGQ